MLYIHYCHSCDTLRMLSGHKSLCPACGYKLSELKISYEQYTTLSVKQRNQLLQRVRSKSS